MTAPANSLLLSIAETAEALRVSKSFLYLLAKQNILPTIRIGHRRMIRRSDVQKFIQVGAPGAKVRTLRLVKP
jgi:excisionase family DNA binding protein